MEDKPVLDDLEKELLEKEILSREIESLLAFKPEVFFYADGIGYVHAWKCDDIFWLECKGVNGKYFIGKFIGDDMISTCESYFSALRGGYSLQDR